MHEHRPVPALSPGEDEADGFDENFHSLSWFVEPGPIAIKKTDRPFFLFRETVIPQKMREFFDVGDLQPGHKRSIVFWLGEDRFDAFIEKTNHLTPCTRMIWKADFAAILGKAYPEWLEFFRKSRGESGETPSVFFTQQKTPHQYSVTWEDAPAPGAAPVEFYVPLKPGDTIDNETLRAIFSCGAEGTMRHSPKTGSLVIVSDHTTSSYQDTWVNAFFHYTGRGLGGKQALSLPENRQLVESKTHGTHLYLFEVFEAGLYVYMGKVELSDRPFISRQADSEKNLHDVYIFPLKLIGHKRPPLHLRRLEETREELLRRKADVSGPGVPGAPGPHSLKGRGMHEGVAPVRKQEPLAPAHTRHPARGICQLCNQPAPFCTRDGEPYLETHPIHRLSEGGEVEEPVLLILAPGDFFFISGYTVRESHAGCGPESQAVR